jgi:regulator of RNase E activity RraB
MVDEVNSEQSSEESNSEQDSQSVDQSSEETQQASTEQQVDTSHEINTTGSKLGLQEKSTEESSESEEDNSESIDSIVQMALNGELTDEQRKIIDDAGLGSHFDMIVQGHQANIEKNDAEIVGVVGGQEAYGELQEYR